MSNGPSSVTSATYCASHQHTPHLPQNVLPVTGHEGAKWRWAGNGMPWLLFSWERDPVPTVQEAGWASEPVWMGTQNLVPTGVQIQTIQAIASCYINYGIPATTCTLYIQPSNHTDLLHNSDNVSRRML
jgi:hypothetical protein